MKAPIRWFVAAALGSGGGHAALAAQTPAEDRLRVFIDCNYCDMDFLRTEIGWIDHMRDRADAHVHVLVTRQQTGAGGNEYTLEFIGLRQFTGRSDTLKHVATADATQDIVRQGLARVIKLGLVPFLAQTPQGRLIDVIVAAQPASATTPATPQKDPWNFWNFRIGMNTSMDGESQANFGYFSGNVTANRTTERWKLNVTVNGSYFESNFKLDSITWTKAVRRSYSASALLVKSLGGHFSAGARANLGTSTFGNTSLSVSLAPAVEYNFVPYAESTRRQFRVQYAAGVRHYNYRELTIFNQIEESRPFHNFVMGYFTRQPWGSINISLDVSQFLHDTGKYNAGVSGTTEFRLFRGFSFNLTGGYNRIRDQITLAARDPTDQEVLLRQRQLATGYRYFAFGGISYRFGSIFNNVVNPRFASMGGFFFIE